MTMRERKHTTLYHVQGTVVSNKQFGIIFRNAARAKFESERLINLGLEGKFVVKDGDIYITDTTNVSLGYVIDKPEEIGVSVEL